MVMADGLNTVARGVEGSGEAQIVQSDPRIFQALQGIQDKALKAEADRLKRAQEANDYMRKELKGYPGMADTEEYGKLYEDYLDQITVLQQETGRYADDPLSPAGKKLAEAYQALNSFKDISKDIEKAYLEGRKNIGNPDVDQDELAIGLEKIEKATNLKERMEALESLNVPSVNWEDVAGSIATSTYTSKIEKGDVTTGTVSFDEKAYRRSMMEHLTTTEKGQRAYQWGVKKGKWSDYEGAVDSAVKLVESEVNESYTRSEDEGNSGGINMNFAGGGSMEFDGWRLTPFESSGQKANKYTGRATVPKDMIGIAVTRKGGTSTPIVLSKTKGVDERGYITGIEIDPNNPEKSYINFKIASKQAGGSKSTLDQTPTQEEIDDMITIKMPLNEENKARLKGMMGFDLDEAIKNLSSQNSSSKAKEEKVEEEVGAQDPYNEVLEELGLGYR